jgi:hypothetical protein
LNGKGIIALGPGIIPYLIQQLCKGIAIFIVPLNLIANLDISKGKYPSIPEISKLWLKWWDDASD